MTKSEMEEYVWFVTDHEKHAELRNILGTPEPELWCYVMVERYPIIVMFFTNNWEWQDYITGHYHEEYKKYVDKSVVYPSMENPREKYPEYFI